MIQIERYQADDETEVVALSLRAWEPVFEKFEPAMQPYVFKAFYPHGWRVRQAADISQFLRTEGQNAWVAVDSGVIAGWMGIRIHPDDRMGEIHIIAVDPEQQRRGIGKGLIDHGLSVMRRAGIDIMMVETGDDPGHEPSRATYENAGFQRWPVARYFREL